ncbi:hypothetical protein [Argonema galeatum]|uniref:hypothetical protein n=1 Tax=Argonema galeatum TaxID=2942762 RepID=UPI0020139D0F|nr:hypothetical protein [Argonema galeatum]MCL1465131.1 hypothetical protein [Argonema galeatum A003/A1]
MFQGFGGIKNVLTALAVAIALPNEVLQQQVTVSASGGEVRPTAGRKSVLRHSPVRLEAYTILASS